MQEKRILSLFINLHNVVTNDRELARVAPKEKSLQDKALRRGIIKGEDRDKDWYFGTSAAFI
jgi:hypothetical protein